MTDNAELDRIALDNDERQGVRVLEAVSGFLSRFVCYPSEHAKVAHTLWCVHTHLMHLWDSTPRLAFLSAEPGSGKSRALEVTALLVPNPVKAINATPNYLIRKVGAEEGCTVLYDEIDTVFGPKTKKDNEEIRGLINAGHRRGQTSGRCIIRGKTVETEDIPAYSAVAMAGLGWLPNTLLTRSVIIRMKKRRADEKVEPFRERIASPQGQRVRMAIEAWAGGIEAIDWPTLPAQIQDRDADVWEALVAVADLAGGKWPTAARQAAVYFVTQASEDVEPSLGVRLLADIRLVFDSTASLPTKVLLADLIALDESPWGDLKGRPLDERGLAQRLKQYGIKSKVAWFGERQARGYMRADFEDQWNRLLPRDVTGVTDITRRGSEAQDDISRAYKCEHCHANGETVLTHYDITQARLHRDCIEPWRRAYDVRNPMQRDT